MLTSYETWLQFFTSCEGTRMWLDEVLCTLHVSGAHLCLSETGRCQRRHCFLLLTGLDHCSYENCALPGFPHTPLISMSLTHVHLRVSDMRIMLRTYRAVAFDPERQREAPSTHEDEEEDAPRPQAEGSFREAWFVSLLLAVGAESVMISNMTWGCMTMFERLTRGEGAQGKARRCNVPGCVCRRLAQEDGRSGRTVEQL